MNYVPATLLRPTRVSDARGPAIVLPLAQHTEAMLVTGGMPAHTCFLGGSHAGHGFLKEQAARWNGLAIEGVDFEVDLSSQFQPALIDQPLGAIIRTSGRLEILVAIKGRHGFEEAHRVPLDEGTPPSADSLEAGFTRWRAMIGQDKERIELFAFEATTTASM